MDRTFLVHDLVNSAVVAGHLMRQEIHMREFLCKANIRLQRKILLLRGFGYEHTAELGEAALRALQNSRNLILRTYGNPLEEALTTFDEAELILAQRGNYTAHVLELWEGAKKTWTFHFCGQYVHYFTAWQAVSEAAPGALLFSPNNMSPVRYTLPFQVGDLLYINGLPFAHDVCALVLTQQMDVIFMNHRRELCMEPLDSIFGCGDHNIVPPLYSAWLAKGTEDPVMEELRNYVSGNPVRAQKVIDWFEKYAYNGRLDYRFCPKN